MGQLFIDSGGSIRLADVLDVVFVSICLYALISWLRESASWKALTGVIVIVGIYVIAQSAGMYLTQQVFEFLLTVIVVVVVVVFQADLRRMIDRMGALWETLGKGNAPRRDPAVVTEVAQAAEQMAGLRRGALIAIRGRESWDHHIEGGIDLEGRVSVPLLVSLFNPGSPAHDGAVLIDGRTDRMMKFAVHLPLSSDRRQLGSGGTRHAAALGLSERCDALVLVVSEERGTVSFAEGGRLEELASASETAARLRQFWEATHRRERVGVEKSFTARRMQTAAMSLLFASTLWFFTGYRQHQEDLSRVIDAPIEFRKLSPDLVLTEPVPAMVRIMVSGPAPDVRRLGVGDVVLSLDVGEMEAGENTYGVGRKDLNLPESVRLDHVEPEAFKLQARKIVRVEVPIKVETQGALRKTLELFALTAEPAGIALMVMDDGAKAPQSISTAPVDLGQITGSQAVTAELVLPAGTRIAKGSPAQVSVRVDVKVREPETK